MSLLMDALKKAEQSKKSVNLEAPVTSSPPSDIPVPEWNDTLVLPDEGEPQPQSASLSSPAADTFVSHKEWWKTADRNHDNTDDTVSKSPSELSTPPALTQASWQNNSLPEFKEDLSPSPSAFPWDESTASGGTHSWKDYQIRQELVNPDDVPDQTPLPEWYASSEPAKSAPDKPLPENHFTTVATENTPQVTTDAFVEGTPGKLQGFSLREWQHEKTAAADDSAPVNTVEDEDPFGPSRLELDLPSAIISAPDVRSSATTRNFAQDSVVPEPEVAQRLFAASASPPTSRRKILYTLLGVTVIGLGVGYYTLTTMLEPSPSNLFKGANRVANSVPPPEIKATPPMEATKTGELQQPPPSPPPSRSSPKPPMGTATPATSPPQATDVPSEPPALEGQSPLLSANPNQVLAEAKALMAQRIQPSTTKEAVPTTLVKPAATLAKPAETPKSNRESNSPATAENAPAEVSKVAKSQPPTEVPKATKSQLPKSNGEELQSPSKSTPPSTASSDPQLQLKKSVSQQINLDITRAYEAFQRGEIKTAEQVYTRVLQQEEANHDALLGLAATATRQGNIPAAQQYYRLLLKFYPQDTYAQVGLVNTLDNRSPTSESQLKLLLAKAPQSAYIHFSLGNLYANQGRWAQAQQAYFEAYRYDRNKADYAYNLAVSLDQLNQPKTALDYYQTALTLGRTQVVSFNLQAIQRRIQTLLNYQ